MKRYPSLYLLFFIWLALGGQILIAQETLPTLGDEPAARNLQELWAGFDPEREPLETEILAEWDEEGVTLRVVRFRIGVFKGVKSTLAGVYGFPSAAKDSKTRLPGLLQIHGGGQYADHKACVANAKRGYATLSIAWAGRISAPGYRVSPKEVKLYWDHQTEDPIYRKTTDWGALDGYHAPSRNPGNQFPSIEPHPWTLDNVESPRNSGWFLCALAARRSLTFLQQQPKVDPQRLGVYGHSMGGKLTVMTAIDPRVKAAVPSCGGISDRDNTSDLFQATLSDDVSLRQIRCPILFLSPSNDFHGRIGDLPDAVTEIQSEQWRVVCSPHHNHQDTPEFEVATLLWMDQHLQRNFVMPQTPDTQLTINNGQGEPEIVVTPDPSLAIRSIEIYYTQHGKPEELPSDLADTKSRFWHHVDPVEQEGTWSATLPLATTDNPLWVFANVQYQLSNPVSGAGYYYRTFSTDSLVVSSVLSKVSAKELRQANVVTTRKPSLLIESFEDPELHDWFGYREPAWSRSTHKLRDEIWHAPDGAQLAMEIKVDRPNKLVILLDEYAAEVELQGGNVWEPIVLSPESFQNFLGESRADWNQIRTLKLSPAEHLHPPRGTGQKPKVIGGRWQGSDPVFRNLRWLTKLERSVSE